MQSQLKVKNKRMFINLGRAYTAFTVIGCFGIFMLFGCLAGFEGHAEGQYWNLYVALYIFLIIFSFGNAISCRICRKNFNRIPAVRRWTGTILNSIWVVSLLWGVVVAWLDYQTAYSQLAAFLINLVIVGVLFIHEPKQWLILSLPMVLALLISMVMMKIPVVALVDDVITCVLIYVSLSISIRFSYRAFVKNERRKRDVGERSVIDKLTGLYNRVGMDIYLNKVFPEDKIRERLIGILFIDIDYFKQYNDFYGHMNGDICLRKMGELLKEIAKEEHAIAIRYGGEEFLLITMNRKSYEVMRIAKRVQKAVRDQNILHEKAMYKKRITVSIGEYSDVMSNRQEFLSGLDKADEALYRAKSLGRDQIVRNAS